MGVMQNNIEKVIQRGEKLDELNEKTGTWRPPTGAGAHGTLAEGG
jgi:hypothetical protein